MGIVVWYDKLNVNLFLEGTTGVLTVNRVFSRYRDEVGAAYLGLN
jgi:hypothetical protein